MSELYQQPLLRHICSLVFDSRCSLTSTIYQQFMREECFQSKLLLLFLLAIKYLLASKRNKEVLVRKVGSSSSRGVQRAVCAKGLRPSVCSSERWVEQE